MRVEEFTIPGDKVVNFAWYNYGMTRGSDTVLWANILKNNLGGRKEGGLVLGTEYSTFTANKSITFGQVYQYQGGLLRVKSSTVDSFAQSFSPLAAHYQAFQLERWCTNGITARNTRVRQFMFPMEW